MDKLVELVGNEKEKQAVRTEAICILDRSGSMAGTEADSIGGYNTFLKKQREDEDETRVTLVLFDHEYKVLYENVDINSVEDLNNETYIPRGSTALNDSIGRTLVTARERHLNMPENERPTNVVVAILTDGHENCSREYTTDKIKTLVKKYEKEYDWKFIYLAANQDAFAVGQNYGFDRGNTLNFADSGSGRRMAFANVSNYTRMSKSLDTESLKACYSQESIRINEDNMDEDFKAGGTGDGIKAVGSSDASGEIKLGSLPNEEQSKYKPGIGTGQAPDNNN